MGSAGHERVLNKFSFELFTEFCLNFIFSQILGVFNLISICSNYTESMEILI